MTRELHEMGFYGWAASAGVKHTTTGLQRSGNVMNSASLSGSLMDSLHYLPEWILPTLKANWIMVWGCLSGHQILQDTSMKRLPEIFNGCSKQRLWFHQARWRSTHQECAPSSWQKPRQCIEHLVDFQSKTPDTTHKTQSELTLKKLLKHTNKEKM